MVRLKKIADEWRTLCSNPALYFDRSFSSGTGKQIGWLLFVFVGVLLLLFAVYCIFPAGGGLSEKFSNLLLLLIDPGDSDSMPIVLTIIVDLFGLVLFGGMLISVVSNMLERRVEAFKNGETTYNMHDHIVIVGYNKSVPSLVRYLRHTELEKDGIERFVVIQSGQPAEEIRNRFRLATEERIDNNIHVVRGQGNLREDLEKLHIDHCKEIWIIGDDTLEAHDSVNMKTLSLVADIWGEEKGLLACHVLFEYQTIYSVFQFSELEQKIKNCINFLPFNIHENWAKKVLVEGKTGAGNNVINYKPLEGENGLESDKHVHLIVVGMSRMGTAMGVEAAQTAHYFNFLENDNATRTHITFIDSNAKEKMNVFMSRFPNVFDTMRWRYVYAEGEGKIYTLKGDTWNNPIELIDSPYRHLGPNFTDLQWEFIDGRVESPEVRHYLTEAVSDNSAITTIAVCLPDTQQATQTALYLPDYVLRNAHQILVYQEENDAIIRNVNNPDDDCKKYDKILPFGIITDSFSVNQISDYEGMWINAYYMLNQKSDDDKKAWEEKDENWAKKKWRAISVSDRWSSIHSANMINTKLRSVGCTIDSNIEDIEVAFNANMQALVFTEHTRWVAEQLLGGFRPLYADEWENYKRTKKEAKKKAEKAHGNICSNAMLAKVDPEKHKNDEQVTIALIEIIKRKRSQNDTRFSSLVNPTS